MLDRRWRRPSDDERRTACFSLRRFSVQLNVAAKQSQGRLRRRHIGRPQAQETDAHSTMFHVLMPYGPPGDFKKATRVASVPTAEAAWGYLDDVRDSLASLKLPLDIIELVVVDEEREPVPRPNQMVQ